MASSAASALPALVSRSGRGPTTPQIPQINILSPLSLTITKLPLTPKSKPNTIDSQWFFTYVHDFFSFLSLYYWICSKRKSRHVCSNFPSWSNDPDDIDLKHKSFLFVIKIINETNAFKCTRISLARIFKKILHLLFCHRWGELVESFACPSTVAD